LCLLTCHKKLPTDSIASTGVLGRIVARNKLLDVGCVLFYSDLSSGTHIGSNGLILEMATGVRSQNQLYMMLLTIDLDLRSFSGDEIVRAAVEFEP
ncbi:Os11g0164100, partial [Oryza sativa Japonica Group]